MGEFEFRPSRGYTNTHPPFETGNLVALKAGDRSPRIVAPLAATIAAELAEAAPWTTGSAFARTVESWAWSEAQCQLLRRWLDEHGLLDDDGVPRAASNRLDKLEGRAASLRAELGLSPLALARLLSSMSGIDVPALEAGYDALRSAGGALVDAARARGDLALSAGTVPENAADATDAEAAG